MVDIKRFVKDVFLLGSGAAAGYTVNELKQRDKRRKLRLGIIGSMGTVYALYMTLNHLGPNYLDYRREIEMMKEKHHYTIDSMRIEKGYDNPGKQIDEFQKQMYEYDKKINSIAPTLEDKIGKNIDNKLDQKLTQKINPIYNDQKKILEEISKQKTNNAKITKQNVVNQESKNIIDSIVDFFTPDNNAQTISDAIRNYSRFIIDIDKSSNTLSLLGSDTKLIYSCPVSLSKSGGPPSGEYKINTIAQRDGDLYPGVMKLTDIIVITGSGENNQYDNAIRNRMNITKTGARITTNDYNKIVSAIRDKNVSVNVK